MKKRNCDENVQSQKVFIPIGIPLKICIALGKYFCALQLSLVRCLWKRANSIQTICPPKKSDWGRNLYGNAKGRESHLELRSFQQTNYGVKEFWNWLKILKTTYMYMNTVLWIIFHLIYMFHTWVLWITLTGRNLEWEENLLWGTNNTEPGRNQTLRI